MGKTTGFMDYTRKTSTDVPPLERIENFNEFHVWLSREEQQTQAARCMDCGVPFCQAGMSYRKRTKGTGKGGQRDYRCALRISVYANLCIQNRQRLHDYKGRQS